MFDNLCCTNLNGSGPFIEMAYEPVKIRDIADRSVSRAWSIAEFQRGFVWKSTQVKMTLPLGILAVVLLAACGEEKKAVELPPPVVTVTAAEQREVKDWDEYTGRLAPLGTVEVRPKVSGYITLSEGGMPQDVRISPDGKIFFVADMKADGVFLIDGDRFTEVGFIKTGVGTHGLYPSRDGTKLYVANRGTNKVFGPPRGKGSVSVIDFTTHHVLATWPIPGGGSPDMGNVSADGKKLWLSGRFDNVVYAIDTTTGEVKSIPVGKEPHGLTVWPQPGRYSLGHTGNLR